ncbi:MAG: UDP-N-acetylmuramate--L-alanine ligase [Candidatus Berkelbacteria bacterium]|nr:UDP-N-acetylmuramate--L-alanine ligase [Candidatus Berkelbacteria bacterium]MCR4308242.1 UDP-N-acetylmuramate--L-alanine ligase [Candidatus Berkelbacteria bacterium]
MAKRAEVNNKLHFIGIKGMGMSGLAIMAKELGYIVTGSDTAEEFPTSEVLRQSNITVFDGFDPVNLKDKPRIVLSAAFGSENLEVKEAKRLRLEVKTFSEILGELMAKFEGIGVAGVHGKTTTSALLAFILQEAGFAPSYMIGAPYVPGLPANGHIGQGKYFIVESDEYKKSEESNEPKFLDFPLKHVIITSIELDHPDMYQTAEEVYQAFYRLSIKIPRDGTIIACIDWPLVRRLVSRRVDRPCLTYGLDSSAQFQVIEVNEGENMTFSILHEEKKIGPFTTKLAGVYNALNATAAIIVARHLGVTESVITRALRKFVGPMRRFQILGEYNGAVIIDDYAHHPTAIKAVIDAAHKRFPTKNITVVFQPHTYSRTGRLLNEFAESLLGADKVILLNIFASAREKSGYVTIEALIKVLKPLKPDMEYRPTTEEVAKLLSGSIDGDDVVLLLGAGDVYKVYQQLSRTDT